MWDTYVFWMNIYGPQIIIMILGGFTYWFNKRLAVTLHRWWLQKYQVND